MNARFRTLVTANCSVKPTAAIARTDAVIRPKPMDSMTRLVPSAVTAAHASPRRGAPGPRRGPLRPAPSTLPGVGACPRLSEAQRGELRCRQVRRHQHAAAGRVAIDLEEPGGVVVGVELRRPAGADVADLLAGLELRHSLGERVDSDRPGDAVA